MNVIFGSAGFAKEVDWLIYDLFESKQIDLRPHFFISKENIGEVINGVQIIAEESYFNFSNLDKNKTNNVFIAVGSPIIKDRIHQRLKFSDSFTYPNLIHPSTIFDKRKDKVKMGIGNIICANNTLTTDIVLGNFVHINLDCTIGHDTQINDYVTISPGSHISGNVNIGKNVFIGTGAVILERINICDNTIIGAGSVVVKSITEQGTYIGTPARKIK